MDVPVWAEIDLNRLRINLKVIMDRLKPGIKIMAVVKGNAYGHGAVKIATELELNGIGYFAVASVGEGVELRRQGIKGTILILETTLPGQIETVFQYHLTPSLYNLELAKELFLKAKQLQKRVKVHLRIDTGMGGLGLSVREIRELIRKPRWIEWLEVEGAYTHLTSDYRGDMDAVREQLESFDKTLKKIKAAGIGIPLVHAVSSLGIFTLPKAHFNMVRPGIAIYGIPPTPGLEKAGLQPIMRLKSRILSLKRLEANEYIGTYHCKYTATEPMTYAIIPIGYADIFFLLTTLKGQVLVRGQLVPIIGQARMNHVLVDVTTIPDVALGDEVVIIGEQGDQAITALEATVAAGIAAMNCESVCLISSRVPRIYVTEMANSRTGRIDLINETEVAAGCVHD